MKLFDTHAHLLDEHFDADRESLIARLPESGVARLMEACCSVSDIPKVVALAEKHDFICGSAGIHPENALEADSAALDAVEKALAHEKIRAVGEIGLDYHYEDGAPRDVQRRVFADQVAIAKAHRVPVIIHDRDAHGDMTDILRAEKQGLSGIMHCFSGSYEVARECLDDGLYIAFGGAVTFKNADRVRAVAAKIPLERLLIETDCPYMTPEPFRGKRNDPGLIRYTLETLARVRNMEPEALSEITYQNALAVYQLTA